MADATYDDLLLASDPAALVVTAAGPDGPSGCLISFATPCSIDPARYVVMLSKANHTHGVAEGAPALAVHVLGEDNMGLASHFGELTGDRVDKFAGIAWRPGPHGVPVLDDANAWMVGTIELRTDLGDHTAFVLAPVASDVLRTGPPLRFTAIRKLDAGHPA